jgi:hypothetical protein
MLDKFVPIVKVAVVNAFAFSPLFAEQAFQERISDSLLRGCMKNSGWYLLELLPEGFSGHHHLRYSSLGHIDLHDSQVFKNSTWLLHRQPTHFCVLGFESCVIHGKDVILVILVPSASTLSLGLLSILFGENDSQPLSPLGEGSRQGDWCALTIPTLGDILFVDFLMLLKAADHCKVYIFNLWKRLVSHLLSVNGASRV